MYVYRPKGEIDTMATTAALAATDLATADAGNGATRLLILSMKGARFVGWITALNGQPGLNLDIPIQDLLLLQANLAASAGAKLTAWTQT